MNRHKQDFVIMHNPRNRLVNQETTIETHQSVSASDLLTPAERLS
jgi:hypothetical protein